MRWVANGFVLSSGRVVYANCARVGIAADLTINGGYDQAIQTERDEWDDDDVNTWTAQERRELAEEMIRMWAEFGGLYAVTTSDPASIRITLVGAGGEVVALDGSDYVGGAGGGGGGPTVMKPATDTWGGPDKGGIKETP